MPDDGIYLVWSHEHRAWWGAGVGIYTNRLSQARRHSRADALQICANAIPDTADRMSALPELPVRLVDVLDMLRDPTGAEYEPGTAPWE